MTTVLQRDRTHQWIEAVESALAGGRRLTLQAGGTKRFLTADASGSVLDLRAHQGIIDYQPSELVVTVRSGTTVAELNHLLAEQGQYFPCEPPEFDGQATVGGMVASAWAGPRRPWSGSIRDYVLGCRLISGQGKHLRFGGQVMKNVAGYDVSRLMAGSFGCLGILTELSLKVLPVPRKGVSRALSLTRSELIAAYVSWRRRGLPVSGVFHDGEQAYVRLEGGDSAVTLAAAELGGDAVDASIWTDLTEQRLPFFQRPGQLWRLSVPVGTLPDALPGEALMDWAGGQWWLKVDPTVSAAQLQTLAAGMGGHASCYDRQTVQDRWQPLAAGVLKLNQRLKAQLDPQQVFQRGWWDTEH